jgi:monofunctional glycosyltransferase
MSKLRDFFAFLWRLIWKTTVWFIVLSVVTVVLFRWLPVPVTPLMLLRGPAQGGEHGLKHEWIPLEKIPNHLQLAVVCTEDQNFLKHKGFDYEAIERALDEAEDGGRKRGASTISQQTAKNVFLWPQSSWIRKGFEVWFTFLIETFWSKERIMEVYLNSIEFGDGIYGAEAAAQHFFKKPASKLTPTESARLAIVLPNPIRFKVGKPTGHMNRRQSWALNQMRLWGGKLNYHPEK